MTENKLRAILQAMRDKTDEELRRDYDRWSVTNPDTEQLKKIKDIILEAITSRINKTQLTGLAIVEVPETDGGDGE
jgi:hypothetical protein